MAWYSAKLLFESRVAGSIAPDALCDEVVLVLEASSEHEAFEKAEQLAHRKEVSYANVDGDEVTWHFCSVLDIQDLCVESIGSGTEVFSRLFRKDGSAL